MGRGDVDDRAARLDEQRQRRAAGSHRGEQVELEHVAPVVVGQAEEAEARERGAGRRPARVVDEHVEAAERARPPGRRPRPAPPGSIRSAGTCTSSPASASSSGVRTAGGRHHAGALLQQGASDGESDSLRSTGDDGDTVLRVQGPCSYNDAARATVRSSAGVAAAEVDHPLFARLRGLPRGQRGRRGEGLQARRGGRPERAGGRDRVGQRAQLPVLPRDGVGARGGGAGAEPAGEGAGGRARVGPADPGDRRGRGPPAVRRRQLRRGRGRAGAVLGARPGEHAVGAAPRAAPRRAAALLRARDRDLEAAGDGAARAGAGTGEGLRRLPRRPRHRRRDREPPASGSSASAASCAARCSTPRRRRGSWASARRV